MILVRERGGGMNYTLTAELRSNGDLVLEGHDLSTWLEESLGRDEYEYIYTVRASHVPRLCELLGVEGAGGVLDRLRDLLAPEGVNASRTWKAWLKERGIPYVFAVR
jgi:hypothetical protein